MFVGGYARGVGAQKKLPRTRASATSRMMGAKRG